MRLVTGIVVLAAALGTAKFWAVWAKNNWVSLGVMAGTVVGFIVFAWGLGIWLRNRQRRRGLDMRDSALW
jgi:hypothetical protein